MNEKMLTKIKRSLREIFTKLIRVIQKYVKKLPDGEGKVFFMKLLNKAKSKLNKVESINNEDMANELKQDANDLQEAIDKASKKYDKKYFDTFGKVQMEDDGETPQDTKKNNKILKKSDKYEKRSHKFDKKYVTKESYVDSQILYDLLYA